jgi:hypothetical protein
MGREPYYNKLYQMKNEHRTMEDVSHDITGTVGPCRGVPHGHQARNPILAPVPINGELMTAGSVLPKLVVGLAL